MKRLAFLYLTLIAGVVALAQQPAEWRPNPAEDNKAATWEDTAAFLSTWFATTGHLEGGEVLKMTTPEKCTIHVAHRVRAADDSVHVMEANLDLRSLDPLSISVRNTMLQFAGTGNKIFLQGSEAIWIPKSHNTMTARLNYDLSASASLQCPDDPKTIKELKSCTVQPVNAWNAHLAFDQQESAHRYARALMHAALLCGGTKAVSPF